MMKAKSRVWEKFLTISAKRPKIEHSFVVREVGEVFDDAAAILSRIKPSLLECKVNMRLL
jgi:hypothetical protein